jgi:hypothetical protein
VLLAVDHVTTRLASLEAQLVEVAGQEPYRERVGWLRCFRGIDTITALNLLAELHGLERFQKPRGLMCYLGLVPSESKPPEGLSSAVSDWFLIHDPRRCRMARIRSTRLLVEYGGRLSSRSASPPGPSNNRRPVPTFLGARRFTGPSGTQPCHSQGLREVRDSGSMNWLRWNFET